MTPLPASTVVHGALVARHAATLASAMTVTVAVTRPGVGEVYDPVTGSTTPAAATAVYSGAARVQALGAQATEQVAGLAHTTLREYLVQVPVSEDGVQVGDRVTVTGVDELTGATLVVADVAGASTAWTRDLRCTVNLRT